MVGRREKRRAAQVQVGVRPRATPFPALAVNKTVPKKGTKKPRRRASKTSAVVLTCLKGQYA